MTIDELKYNVEGIIVTFTNLIPDEPLNDSTYDNLELNTSLETKTLIPIPIIHKKRFMEELETLIRSYRTDLGEEKINL